MDREREALYGQFSYFAAKIHDPENYMFRPSEESSACRVEVRVPVLVTGI